MTLPDKLLVQQAWSLRKTLDHRIEAERLRRMPDSMKPTLKIERLTSVHDLAYSRYVRRLKKLWGYEPIITH